MASYHIELRDFPRNLTRFNLTGPEVGPIALTWADDRMLTFGDEKWSPANASLTILEGPSIPIERLTMGRGWTIAQREGQDVTERVIAEAREQIRQAAAPSAANGHTGAQSVPDPPALASATPAVPATPAAEDPLAVGVDLAGLLGPGAGSLLAAWRAVAARSTGLAPSESLALAERELAAGSEPAG
jgi:hypothetical protein